MPKKRKTDEVEKVEGRVEGLTYSEEEQRIRATARDTALAAYDSTAYGTNKMSVATGQVMRNRAQNRGTRERTYSCGAELAGMIDAYWCVCFRDQEHGVDVLPDTEHMADFLGVTRDTLLRWSRGEDNLEFVEPVKIALSEIALVKKQKAFTDRVNGLVVLADLNNNHGYASNQKSTDLNVNVRLKHDLPPIEQLNEQIKLLP